VIAILCFVVATGAVIETLNDLGIKAHGNDIDSIVKTIEEKIPNPRKGDSFVDDAKAQADICKKIAAAVNKGMKSVYGDRVGDLIDPKGPPEYVCSSVVDLIHSFSSGIQLEYLSVRDSLQKVITELAAAHEVLKSSVNNFMSKLNENDVDFDTGADKFIAIYQKAEQEIALKIQVLSGLLKLNVMPSLEELELAMKSESEGRDYVNSIIGIGTQDFGDSIAYAINNMGTVVELTNIINKSLKKLDMSMDEYLNIDSLKQLDAILNKKLDEIISKNNSNHEKKDDLTSILIAVDKLKKYFVSKNKLKKMKGGNDENVTGGAITTTYKPAHKIREEKLDKRIKALQKSQEILYNAFVKELYGAYDELLKVINAFGPKIGTQIPIGPHIDDLIQVFQRLSKSKDLRSKDFELDLSGLQDNNLASKERKALFLQLLRDIIRHCEQANQHHSSDYFATLKQAVKLLIEVIERFNKLAKIKFGGQVEQLQADIAAVGGADSYSITYDPRYVFKDSIKLDEAVGTMIYYYYIANVKSNIKNNAKEVASYGQSYEKMLEEAIRFKREDLVRQKKAIIDDLQLPGGPIPKVAGADANADVRATYTDLLEKKFNAYDNLLRVVEAIDLHLKDTTVSLVDNPDLVKNLKKTLDSSRIIAKWFNEETGTELFKAFLATSVGGTDYEDIMEDNRFQKHPYLPFAGKDGPDFGVVATQFPEERRSIVSQAISDSVDNFQALQNIINIFILIGGPTKKSLSARQMFKYLVDYIKISAINDSVTVNGGGVAALASTITNVFDDDTLAGGAAIANNHELVNLTAGITQPRDIQADMNTYFKYIMKSITGKIFVVLGMYQLLESPTPMNEISDVRYILGGNDYETASIIPEASEFYYRIPRVLEYYRNLFVNSFMFNESDLNALRTTHGFTDATSIDTMITNKKGAITTATGNRDTEYGNIRTQKNTIETETNDLHFKNKEIIAKEKEIADDTAAEGTNTVRLNNDLNNLTNDKTTIETNITNAQTAITTAQQAANGYSETIRRLRQEIRDLQAAKQVINNEGSSITILIDPEMKFYELFSLIWDQIPIESVRNGTYSDIECNRLINAINKVYNQYKDKQDPIKTVIQEIIWEVNRRYGIISRNEIKKFGDLRRYRKLGVNTSELNRSNGVNMIDILPDEEEIELTGVPSDNIIMDVNISSSNVDALIRQQNKIDLAKYDVLNAITTANLPSGVFAFKP
jgi:hypothetical protein